MTAVSPGHSRRSENVCLLRGCPFPFPVEWFPCLRVFILIPCVGWGFHRQNTYGGFPAIVLLLLAEIGPAGIEAMFPIIIHPSGLLRFIRNDRGVFSLISRVPSGADSLPLYVQIGKQG